MHRITWIVLLLCGLAARAGAQAVVRGTLRDARTDAPMRQARIRPEGAPAAVTDGRGRFSLPLPGAPASLRLHVTAIGVDTVLQVDGPFGEPLRLRVAPHAFTVDEVVVRGASAREIVLRAVARIPNNYPDSGGVYYGFYRQFDRYNKQLQNLLEARMAVVVQPLRGTRPPEALYGFALLARRKHRWMHYNVDGLDDYDGLADDLFNEDPVYHLAGSSLSRPFLERARFRFDTTGPAGPDYVIRYDCDISSEDHGLAPGTSYQAYEGESTEAGVLTIDRASLAIRRWQRRTGRNTAYSYPRNNNFIWPRLHHYVEFRDGELDVSYEPRNGRWFLSAIRHRFSNDFFRTATLGGGYAFTLGEFYEWQTDSVSRTIRPALREQLVAMPYIHLQKDDACPPLEGPVPECSFMPKAALYEAVGWKAAGR